MTTYEEYLAAAAKAVAEQVTEQVEENSLIGIPVDPDVAEFMGAFPEQAVNIEELESTGEENG